MFVILASLSAGIAAGCLFLLLAELLGQVELERGNANCRCCSGCICRLPAVWGLSPGKVFWTPSEKIPEK